MADPTPTQPSRLQRELPFGRRKLALRKLATSEHVKSLLRVLHDHAGEGSICWLSLPTLSREMGPSIRTVQRAIAEAKALGFVYVGRRNRATHANVYTILWSQIIADVFGEAEETQNQEVDTPLTRHSHANLASQPAELTRQLGVSTHQLTRHSHAKLACGIIRIESSLEEEVLINKENPPPPEVSAHDWKSIERAVAAFGVADAARAVRAARDHGCQGAEVAALIEFARTHRADWDQPAGALWSRLNNAWPQQATSEGWPKISKARETAARQNATREAVERNMLEQRQSSDGNIAGLLAEAVKQLELRFGSELDAVPVAGATELIAGLLGETGRFAISLWRRTGSKWPPIGELRRKLLRGLDRRQQQLEFGRPPATAATVNEPRFL